MSDEFKVFRTGFKTTRVCGPDNLYEINIKYRSIEDLHEADDELRAALSRASSSRAEVEIPEGWKLIAVNEWFDAFMSATHRADNKGYLPDAMRDEWAAFDYNAVPLAAAEAPNEGDKQ